MKSFIIYTLFLLLVCSSYAQFSSGKTYYGVKANESFKKDLSSNVTSKNKGYKSMMKATLEVLEDINFVLEFNDDISVFKLLDKPPMSNDENLKKKLLYGLSIEMVNKGDYFTDKKEDEIIFIPSEVMSNEYLVMIPSKKNDWKLHRESKKIGEYTVFKASLEKIVQNSTGDFKFEIIAWYCPALPNAFGPLEYSGLPGMILELKDTHHTYFCEKIIFEKVANIDLPEEGKSINEEEYNQMLRQGVKDFRNMIKS